MKYDVLIVDDEPHARKYLRDILDRDPEVTIVGELSNGREAVSHIQGKAPEIIFLDIQMPGMDGVEVARIVKQYRTIIIITTAFDNYALKAFEVNAIDYLLKPFDEERLQGVLTKAKRRIEVENKAKLAEDLLSLFETFKSSKNSTYTFVIKDKGFERTIDSSHVLYIESDSVYVTLHLAGETVLLRSSLKVLEKELPPDFIRIHRAILLNSSHVRKVSYRFNNTYMFELGNGDKLVSSRSYKASIMNRLSSSRKISKQ